MNPPLLLPSPSFRWHFTQLLSLQLKQSDLHMRSSKGSCPAPCPAHIRSYSAAASNDRSLETRFLDITKAVPVAVSFTPCTPRRGIAVPSSCEPRPLQQEDVDITPSGNMQVTQNGNYSDCYSIFAHIHLSMSYPY